MTAEKIRVYFTIDVETSLGGSWRYPQYTPVPLDATVFGRIGCCYYGIPLIMDILEEHGFRGTFFTEIFCGYTAGHEDLGRALHSIRARGHDAQLHLHPVYRFYRDYLSGKPRREEDLMFTFPAEEQHRLVAEGISLFRDLTGTTPRAYRAGCYGASETTLGVLRQNGIEIDSSYNLAYLGKTCGFRTGLLNAPVKIEGVWEFPVTVFRVPGSAGYKPLEISAVSVAEIVGTIRSLRRAGCRDVVLVLHSFSLLKNVHLRFEDRRPDRLVIRRLRNLCAALSQLSAEVEVQVLGETDVSVNRYPQPHLVPSSGWVQPMARKFAQAMNRIQWV